MNIEKYACTESYGFGFLNGSYGSARFNPNVCVVAKSKKYSIWVAKKVGLKGAEEGFRELRKLPSSWNPFSPSQMDSGLWSENKSLVSI